MIRAWMATAFLGFAAASCSRAPAPPRAETVSVVIDKVVFQQVETHAKVGDTIEWVNKDLFTHTSTSRDPQWDLTIEPGQSAKAVMTHAGTFDYFCRLHPNMTGRVIIGK